MKDARRAGRDFLEGARETLAAAERTVQCARRRRSRTT